MDHPIGALPRMFDNLPNISYEIDEIAVLWKLGRHERLFHPGKALKSYPSLVTGVTNYQLTVRFCLILVLIG